MRRVDPDLPKTSWRRSAAFRLGDLEVHPESGEVRSRRGVERLRPLLVDVLLRLAASPGEVVRRERLLEEVWPRRMVNDEVLSRAIAELRTALGDDAKRARYIETLPKVGYRLVAGVEPLEPTRPEAAPPAAGADALIAPQPRALAPLAIGAGIFLAAVLAGGYGIQRATGDSPAFERKLTTARPFASDLALEVAPRFSPDGTRVVFVLGEGSRSRLVIQSLDGLERRVLGDEGYLYHSPVFFPDGKRIAYWRAKDRDCAILEHDLTTGEARSLADCRRSPRARFDLSPDGRRIVFSGSVRPQYPWGLVLLDLESGETRDLTTPEPGTGDDAMPRFSPDGRRIAYFHGDESHRQLWLADLDSGSQRAITRQMGLAYGAAWLGPDGPLVVAADWFGFRALNVVEVRTGQARIVGARGARYPDVSARGDLVYEHASYTANLWRLDLRAGTAEALWPSTRYTSQPQVSPDGRRVVFASNREGDDALYLATPGAEPWRLPLPAGYRYLRPRWSADGTRIYAIRASIGAARTSSAVRLDLERGTHEALTALGNDVTDVREAADGRALYYGETAGLATRLLRTSVERPLQGERLALPLVGEFQLGANMLVFSQPQLEGLTICTLPALSCERLDVEVGDFNRFAWALTPGAIYYRGRSGGIARYDLARRAAAPTNLAAFPGVVQSLAGAPGESLVVSSEERLAVDLMLAR